VSIWKLFAITNVLRVGMASAQQIDSFEKQASSLLKAMPASGLPASGLPASGLPASGLKDKAS
jgi:hypothetical protein